jgi:hypothetical protein
MDAWLILHRWMVDTSSNAAVDKEKKHEEEWEAVISAMHIV